MSTYEAIEEMFQALGMSEEEVKQLLRPAQDEARKDLSVLIGLAAADQQDLLIEIFETQPDFQNINYVKLLLGLAVEALAGYVVTDPVIAAEAAAAKIELDQRKNAGS